MVEKSWAIGVDLGGTKTHVARVSAAGDILEEQQFATEARRSPAEITAQIAKTVRALDKDGTAPVGVGVAGQVDGKTGAVIFGPNLKWSDVPLQSDLSKALHQNVAVLNDVRAHTWGEWLHGAGKGCNDFVCLFIGTGIGGGVVSGGHMVHGAHNAAGELGHMIVNPIGPRCGCGNNGCLEAWASGANLAAQARQAIVQVPNLGRALLKLADGHPENITTKTIAQAYSEGDPLAEKLLQGAVDALVLGGISIVHAFNPKRLILGGGVIKGLPHIIPQVERGIRKSALHAASEHLEVVEATLKNDAAVIGAAAFARMNAAQPGSTSTF